MYVAWLPGVSTGCSDPADLALNTPDASFPRGGYVIEQHVIPFQHCLVAAQSSSWGRCKSRQYATGRACFRRIDWSSRRRW